MMTYVLDEIYQEARSCVAGLRGVGLADDAEALDAALYGATSGEILTDLGFRLSAVVRSHSALPADLHRRIAELLGRIERVLKDAGQG